MLIREGRAEDVGAVVRLWREMWDFHTPFDPRFQATPAADVAMASWVEMHLESERSVVLVAEVPPAFAEASEGRRDGVQGYLLGMILESFPGLPAQFYGRVSEIAVRERRTGTGAKLLEAAHAWFRRHGVPYVEVEVSVKNPVARSFWRKQGYGEFLERLRYDL
jgi:GNAT superfamily N-acetyltransferase